MTKNDSFWNKFNLSKDCVIAAAIALTFSVNKIELVKASLLALH